MKKFFALIHVLATLLFTFVACGEPKDEAVKINIGVMSGPTGMGMAKLMNDNGVDSDKYAFSTFSSPTDATASLANGELDMLCVPTNLAANLANKQSDYVTVLSINCLGSLYLVSDGSLEIDSIDDLAGQTIYYGEATSTTGPILDYILAQNDVTATLVCEDTMDAVAAKMVNGEISLAVLPEPRASAAMISAKAANKNYSIALNLSDEWSNVSDSPLTMGCIIVRNDFLADNKSTVDAFLSEYKTSIEYVNNSENHEAAAQMIVDAGVLPKLPVAKSALTNLYGSIVYMDGDEMIEALEDFYVAIEISLPTDEFYYEK